MTENEALECLKSSKRKNDILGILPGSDIGNTIIKALEEVQQYRAICTPEECQALKNRLTAKKVPLRHIRKFDGFDDGECPTCGKSVSRDFDGADIFCPDCGQKLDWSDEE